MAAIYALKDPITGHIRYIGQTVHPKKRLNGHLHDPIRCHRTNWIADLKSRGLIPEFEILFQVPAIEASEWEIKTIAQARKVGMDLVNQTDGGTAPMLGKKHTPEAIVKMSGVNHPCFGKPHSTERRKAQSLKMTGRKFTPEHCKNMGLVRQGVSNHTEAWKLELAEKMSGEGNPYHAHFGPNHPAFGTKRDNASSPLPGVSWDKTRSKWRAAIKFAGKYLYIGRFDTEKEAAEAVVAKVEQLTKGLT